VTTLCLNAHRPEFVAVDRDTDTFRPTNSDPSCQQCGPVPRWRHDTWWRQWPRRPHAVYPPSTLAAPSLSSDRLSTHFIGYDTTEFSDFAKRQAASLYNTVHHTANGTFDTPYMQL